MQEKERINWKIEGMTCSNCALSVEKYLTQKGAQNVAVNFMGGDVSFTNEGKAKPADLQNGISSLGYRVVTNEGSTPQPQPYFFKNHLHRFLFCLLFSLPLFLHMLGFQHAIFSQPLVQLTLTLPVFVVGMNYFGKSAINSLLKGIANMNVLIALGAVASFMFSLYGTISGQAEQYLFYETTATIITLVFFGYWLEDKSVQTTQAALDKLVVFQ